MGDAVVKRGIYDIIRVAPVRLENRRPAYGFQIKKREVLWCGGSCLSDKQSDTGNHKWREGKNLRSIGIGRENAFLVRLRKAVVLTSH